jgi:RNA polymerase sigma-70 factor (ECF subfamily)
MVTDHIGFVGRVLRNFGVPPAEIDDAVQHTFLVTISRLDDILPAAEKSFLFSAARHVAGHARRHLARRRTEPLGDREPVHDASPERALTKKRSWEMLQQILDGLPEEQREVFILFEFEDLTGPEIAQLLGVPGGTVASRLRRARERFKAEVVRLETPPAIPLHPRLRYSGA